MVVANFKVNVTETRKIVIELPEDFPIGEANIRVEVPTEVDDISVKESTWTDEEIEAMIHPDPKTGAEIVARLHSEPGWEDSGIADGAEWVQEQRRKRRERRQW